MNHKNQYELLQSLSDKEKKGLFANCKKEIYPKNSIIFEFGEKTKDVYFIESGKVKSINYGANGEISFFRTREAGNVFGYYSAITNEARSAHMVTVKETVLYKMEQQAFLKLVCNHPDIARYFIQLLGGLLRTETFRFNNIITLSARERIMQDLKVRNKNGSLEISSREEYASYLNMTRETLSRELNRLKKEKIITLKRNQIILTDSCH